MDVPEALAGNVEFDDGMGICGGGVFELRHITTFQGESVEETKKAFRAYPGRPRPVRCRTRGGRFAKRQPRQRESRGLPRALHMDVSRRRSLPIDKVSALRRFTILNARCAPFSGCLMVRSRARVLGYAPRVSGLRPR